ncbi:MAG: hypothetical protein DYG94_01590 [Leptolyngbya sp. PLA3]|nr:MAG: hypothetical protein EDM82_00295 [Cyanobacteria bacterium CYA]MCE7967424.1 hypothetical protein [Leptolyngbya sp. PL-A3]
MVRADRGARLLGLRVVHQHDEATWQSPAEETPDVASDARAAAEWLAERLAGNGRSLSHLIIDTDGGLCSWVSAADTSEPVLRAVIERPFDADEEPAGGRFPELPGETALQPLLERPRARKGAASEPVGRMPVLALPVVPARMLVDELDRMGIKVGAVEALWQACAMAWDPSGSSLGGSHAERVVAEAVPTAAVVLLDPAGRLVWSWSRGASLIAGGSMRILTERASESAPETIERGRTRLALIRDDDIARLGAEWLAWSLQLGTAPARIVIVGEPGEGGLTSAQIGSALSQRWPQTTIDFVREQDPIGATLGRLTGRDGASPAGINELTNRPGRAHRAMYRWAAVALCCAAGVLGTLAYHVLESGAKTQAAGTSVTNAYAELAGSEGLNPATALLDLQSAIEKASKAAIDPSTIEAPRPVLQELEAMSFVLSSDELTLRELTISPLSITLKVEVAQTEQYEALAQSIRAVSGSVVEWRNTLNARGGVVEATFTGDWPRNPGGQN